MLFAHYNVNKQWVLHNHHRDGHRQRVQSLYRNVHTGLRQGKEPGSIVSYYAGPVSRACPGTVPFPFE